MTTRLMQFVDGRSLAEIYDEEWVPAVLEPFAQDLAELSSEGDSVLDVGCGTGLVAHLASERVGEHGRVVGLDPTGFLLDRARSKSMASPTEWVEGDVMNMQFGESTFDLVVCHQAIQYMDDPAAAMGAMARVAKPGARVAVSVWSPIAVQDPVRDFEELIAKHIGPTFATLHAFTYAGLDELRRVAESAKLSIGQAERTQHTTSYESIAACAELMLAGAGHTRPDGSMGMGLFDLENAEYAAGAERLITELEGRWSRFVRDGRLEIPYYSDVIVARGS